MAQANYFAEIDPLTCTACGACEERCQVHAVAVKDDVRVVRRESCVGRGLCVTGCPAEAARLRRKPEGEIVAPPATRGPWERVRLRGRSVSAT